MKLLLSLLTFFTPLFSLAQELSSSELSSSKPKFIWALDAGVFLDNQETTSSLFSPITLSGVWIQPTIGIQLDENNSFHTGVNFLQEFGKKPFSRTPDFLAYYNYQDAISDIYFGILPRNKMNIQSYPTLFYADYNNYFTHTISGGLLKWKKDKIYSEVFFDWNITELEKNRENFVAGSHSKIELYEPLYAVYHLYYQHYRGGVDEPHPLIDNAMYNVGFELNFDDYTVFNKLSLTTTLLGSVSRARGGDPTLILNDTWVSNLGVNIQLIAQYEEFGVENTFYTGDNLMPYWDLYGTRLYYGNPYYTSTLFNQTNLYWEKTFLNNNLSFRITFQVNASNQGIGISQLAVFQAKIN